MSTFESSFKSLLQGVSQQIPKERLPGQVSSQLNMMSDPVTNLRRRPGAQMVASIGSYPSAAYDTIQAWFTDVSGMRVHVILNTATGRLKVMNEAYVVQATLEGGAYLTASIPTKIRATTIGNEFFLCNVDKNPVKTGSSGSIDPVKAGFFFIVSGSFSRAYSVTVSDTAGQFTATYTTPTGAGAGDAALATPEYIATQLVTALNTVSAGRWNVYRVSAYVYITAISVTNITLNASTGSAYLIASKDAYVTAAGNLPEILPTQANGFICRVGSVDLPQYFTYDSTRTAWLESGAYGSPTSLTNCPISLYWTGSAWALNTTAFEGRFAGDIKSNPDPAFIDYGVSGFGTYQGRLVILAGPQVCLSASANPRRFYRSTVTSILDSDPIGVGSAMNSSAAYEYCMAFQKDLLLFSSAYQALIPSGNQAITPRTATVVPTSGHEVDTTSSPIVMGRTVMYASPRSTDFFGVMELIPSPYTDSQYVSQDATPHLPKYMGGRCRFSVSSSVASMALFAPSGDPHSLIVHEYQWNGDEKVQQAWHTWTFPYPVATAYFAFDRIVLGFAMNSTLIFATIDPKVGVLTFDAARRPFLDLWTTQVITDHVVTIPAVLSTFDPTFKDKVKLTVMTGDLAGELVGSTVTGATLTTVLSHPSGDAGLGIPYRSSFAPSPPIIRDSNEVAISTNKATILRYLLGTKNSSEFDVVVTDNNSEGAEEAQVVGTLYWSSKELELGRALFSTDSVSIIPCRTNSNSTVLEVTTEKTGELNITSVEYVMRYHQKIKRR